MLPGRCLPLSLSLLREAQLILMTGVRGDYPTPATVPAPDSSLPPTCSR
ncbi:hypothetical protein [Nocardia fluminea]